MQKQFCGSDAFFQCISELINTDVLGLEKKNKRKKMKTDIQQDKNSG